MNRRTLLACFGTVSGSLVAGCIDNRGSFGRTEYQECPHTVIFMENIPAEVDEEVTTALEDGSYETESNFYLTDIMDPDSSYLRDERDDSRIYYQPIIESRNGTKRLLIEEAIPTSHSILFRNWSEEEVSVSAQVTFKPYSETFDDEVVVDDDFKIAAEESTTLVDGTKYGFYSAKIELQTGEEVFEKEWEIDMIYGSGRFFITEGVEVSFSQDMADIFYCEWDDSGEVTY